MKQRRQPVPYGRAGLLFVALAAAGCAGGSRGAPVTEDPRLVWPAPPQTARIRFVRSIVGENDVLRDTTFSQQLLDLLAGTTPPPTRIVEPMGVAVSDDGRHLYVANFSRMAVFAFDFADKSFRRIEPLANPAGLALDAAGNLYVVEQAAARVSVFDPAGNRIGSITHPSIERPTGIAIDRTRGRIYVADTGRAASERHDVKVFDLEGNLLTTVGEGKGSEPGQLLFPTYLAVGPEGRLYVTDTLNSRVQVFDAEGAHVETIGQRGTAWGMFDKPKGVALDSFGNVYVVDSGWSNVQIFNPKGQVLLFFGGRGPIPGMLKNPTAIAIDKQNKIYVADFIHHRVNIYELVNTTADDSYLDPAARAEGGDG